MDLKLVRALVRIMKGGDVNELELEDSTAGTKIRLRRGAATPEGGPIVNVMPGSGGMVAPGAGHYSGETAAAAQQQASGADAVELGLPAGTQEVMSPMVGTFYLAASPEAEPFVEVGSSVTPDSTICIVEAMKVMNEIKAEISGTVVEILVENGEPVEHGQALFLVKTG